MENLERESVAEAKTESKDFKGEGSEKNQQVVYVATENSAEERRDYANAVKHKLKDEKKVMLGTRKVSEAVSEETEVSCEKGMDEKEVTAMEKADVEVAKVWLYIKQNFESVPVMRRS